MAQQRAPGRLARLAAHLGTTIDEPTSSGRGSGVERHTTAAVGSAAAGGATAAAAASASATAALGAKPWHLQQTYFDPGSLLLGQTAIITGAGSGIGRAVSQAACRHDA